MECAGGPRPLCVGAQMGRAMRTHWQADARGADNEPDAPNVMSTGPAAPSVGRWPSVPAGVAVLRAVAHRAAQRSPRGPVTHTGVRWTRAPRTGHLVDGRVRAQPGPLPGLAHQLSRWRDDEIGEITAARVPHPQPDLAAIKLAKLPYFECGLADRSDVDLDRAV